MIKNHSFLCPVCKQGEIINKENEIVCAHSLCGTAFLNISGKPVLVDFNNSVINRENILEQKGKSDIPRNNSNILPIIKKILFGDGYITQRNITSISKYLSDKSDLKILVVGGGTIGAGLKKFYKDFESKIYSFDIYYSQHIDFIADAHDIPLKNESYDLVIIQAVLEHVISPARVVEECFRILKSGGMIYAETPFMQQVHEGPYDFTRFTDSGHRSLFGRFSLINSGVVAGAGTSLTWSLGYFFSGVFRSYKIGVLVRVCFFWIRFIDRIIPEKYNIDSASGLFFWGKKVSTNGEIENSDLIDYYKGAQTS